MGISEVAKKLNVSTHTLRYYEKIGLIPEIEKPNGKDRVYNEYNVRWLELIICMKETGFNLDEIKKYVELYGEDRDTSAERRELLLAQKAYIQKKMDKLQDTVDYLDFKLELIEEEKN